MGGTAVIEGVTVQGAQNIFFAELASRTTEVFSVSATRFMSGKFPFMIFGLPGAEEGQIDDAAGEGHAHAHVEDVHKHIGEARVHAVDPAPGSTASWSGP